jgi:hypothetical protein
MGKMTWFKLHSEFRNDPKVKRLPIAERYAFIVLLCLASECETRGVISGLDDDDIAFELEMQAEDWKTLKAKFRVKGFIDFTQSEILIRNWDKRQYDKPSDHPEATKQRKRLQRERERMARDLEIAEMSRDVTPMSLAREEEIRSEEIRGDQPLRAQEKKMNAPCKIEISLPEEKKEELDFEDHLEDPKTPPLPPLDAPRNYAQEMSDRFTKKTNRFAPRGLDLQGFSEWHLGGKRNNWHLDLIAIAKAHLKKHEKPFGDGDAINFINGICMKEDWAKFELFADEAKARQQKEQAQAQRSQQHQQPQTAQELTASPPPAYIRERFKTA